MKRFNRFLLLMLSFSILIFLQSCPDSSNPTNSPVVTDGVFNTTKGGILKTNDGAELLISAGAISNQKDGSTGEVAFTIKMNINASDLPVPIPVDYTIIGSIYQFGPSKFVFNGPVQIFLPASNESTPYGLVIIWYDEVKKGWNLLPVNTIDATGKRIGANIFELGYFAVVKLSKTTKTDKGKPQLQSPEPIETRVGGIRMKHNMTDYFVTMTVKSAVLKYPDIPWPEPVGDAGTNGSDAVFGPLPTTYLGNIPQGIFEIIVTRVKRGNLFSLPGKTETYSVPIFVLVTPYSQVAPSWDEWDWLGWSDLVLTGGEWIEGCPDNWKVPTIPGTSEAKIKLNYTKINMKINEVKEFLATVDESIGDKSVSWSATGGWVVPDAIDPHKGIYTAPAFPGVYRVYASLISYPEQKAYVEVTVGDGGNNNSFWKQTGKEIWWSHQINTNYQSGEMSPLEKVSDLPFGQDFTVDRNSYGKLHYTISGAEFNYTCTDSAYGMGIRYTTNFSWDPLPATMIADTPYEIGAETKGTGGNMMHISNSYKVSSGTNDWILYAYRNAGKTFAKVKISKPTNLTNPDKMAIKVLISSTYASIEYRYIYEWVTE